jgi:hypothetical protein
MALNDDVERTLRKIRTVRAGTAKHVRKSRDAKAKQLRKAPAGKRKGFLARLFGK